MAGKPPVTGSTPEQRRVAREARRAHNRAAHVTMRALRARNGRERLVAACNAALAAGKRMTDDGRQVLAYEISQAVERASNPQDGKETR